MNNKLTNTTSDTATKTFEIRCPVCLSNEYCEYGRSGGRRFVQCDECGTDYVTLPRFKD